MDGFCLHARPIHLMRKTQTDDIEYMLRAAGQVLISIAQRSVQRKSVYGYKGLLSSD